MNALGFSVNAPWGDTKTRRKNTISERTQRQGDEKEKEKKNITPNRSRTFWSSPAVSSLREGVLMEGGVLKRYYGV